MARIELEPAIDAEASKPAPTRGGTRGGWGCDALYKDTNGNPTTESNAAYIEVTTFNGDGFHEVVNVPMSEGKNARQLSDEFLHPTIEEVNRRREIKGDR